MTTGVASSYSGAAPAGHSGAVRTGIGVLGVLAVLAGGFLLFHPYSAARTLALLIGAALVIGGLLEFAAGWARPTRLTSVLLGAVLVIGGFLAALWPHVTLHGLALIVGLVLILHGIGRLALAFLARGEIPGWGWLALAGAVNVLIGVLAIAWPEATVLVLSVILGLQVLLFGLILTAVAFWPANRHSSAPAG